MNLDNVLVVDIEAKGFLDKIHSIDDIHVLTVAYYSKKQEKWVLKSSKDVEFLERVVSNPENIIVGHNFIGYDKPALEQAGIEFNAKVIDTLGLSYYLYSGRALHGLEAWGTTYGIKKVEIADDAWETLSYEEAVHRCEEDVKINTRMWLGALKLMDELYENDRDKIVKVINLCNFMMEMLREQELNKIKLDVELTKKNIGILQEIYDEKVGILKNIMPKVPKYAKRTRPKNLYNKPLTLPKKMFDKDGNLTKAGKVWIQALEDNDLPEWYEGEIKQLSAAGERWFRLVNSANLPEDYDGEIKEVIRYEEPNPGSSTQVKNWLFTMDWKPCTFKDGANGPVPQLNNEDDKQLTDSVLELAEKVEEVMILAGMSVAKHRLGVVKGFLECVDEDGYLTAGASKFTRTFRYAHKKPIVNLPSNTGAHGELIRKCLIAPEGYYWVNADLDSLEDKCKAIQVAKWATPEYLNKPPDYDPHLEISVMAKFMTQEESDFFKYQKSDEKIIENCPVQFRELEETAVKELMSRLGDLRSIGKKSNYSCVYGVGAKTLSKSTGLSEKEAGALIKAYWDIHYPVKQYSETLVSKTVQNKLWVYSPYTELWLEIKGDHNKFSAVTQNFGAVVHARMMYFLRKYGIKIIMNIHDEESWYCKIEDKELHEQITAKSIHMVNKSFPFETSFGSTPEFAGGYGEVH